MERPPGIAFALEGKRHTLLNYFLESCHGKNCANNKVTCQTKIFFILAIGPTMKWIFC